MITFIKRIVVLLFVTVLLGSAQAAPAFPVRYSTNNRYLVDQNGTPFPIMGRTAWFVLSLSIADYHTFIDDTASRGYSAIELHVINHDPRGNHPPYNGNGDLPFLRRLDGTTWNGALWGSAPDFTTPNEAYWSFVDGFLSYCESKGILVFLFPAYVGWQGGDQGWMKEIVANGDTKIHSYGVWIATRYKNQKNLVWMMGGDMGTPPYTFDTAQTSVENALLTGLKSVTGQQSVFFSAEWVRRSIATDQTTFGVSMTLNGVYSSSDDVNTLGRRAYAYNPIEPAYLLEEPYDQEGSDGNGVNLNATQPVRRFQWWGWLSTIGGYISGNGYVWPFVAPAWQAHLDTQGSRDMARLNAFIKSIPWYNLVPSGLAGMRTLVTAGGGSSPAASDYVSAAAAPDRALVVAYVPPDHTGSITVDMAALGGLARARWFDPTSAGYSVIGTGLANSGTRSFTPPGNNSAGAKDWVLLLDTTTGNNPAAPTISDIANQFTAVNTTTMAIGFTVGDPDTAATSLTLSGSSSNPTLVPNANIVFGGSGANRTVTVTPAANQTGTTTITVTVSDGTNTASDTFVLTVSATNNSLVAAYSFNEGTGTSIADASGNANTGTIGAATWTNSGKYGNALSFNGTSARVTVNDSTSLDLTTAMTLEAWVYPTSVGGWRDVIYKGPDDIYYLMGSSGNANRPALGGTFAPAGVFGTTSLPLNTWSHLAGTYDGATMRLYVNGVQVGSQAQTGSIQTSTGALTMGGDSLYGQYWAGRIDEVRIYNRALSAGEIQTDMNTPVGGTPPQDTQVPTPPGSLAASAANGSQINLSWAASTDNVGVTGYRVERSQGAGSTSYMQVGTPTGTTFNDTGLAGGTVYNYRARAMDAAGNLSAYSNVASATTASGPSGLVAAYGFNEGMGTGVTDASGHGNAGTIGTATWTTGGKFGQALSFNGTSARVTVNDSTSLDLTTAMTLEAWVYPTSVGGWRDVIYKGPNDIYYLMGSSSQGSKPALGGTFAPTGAFGTTKLPLSTWSHLAGTYDGATMRLYVNGVQVDSRAQTGSIQTSTGVLTMGGDSLYGQYWAGRIDEVRIYNRALSAGEIQTDMNAPVDVLPSLASALLVGQPPQITSVALGGQGAIQMIVSGEVGLKCALEASDDLVNWTIVGLQDNATGSVVFSDQMEPRSARFYRSVSIARRSPDAR